MSQTLSPETEASIEGLEAQAAVGRGDTDAARAHARSAARALESDVDILRGEALQLRRFLIASQYYHGGHYQEARKWTRRVEAPYLIGDTRQRFEAFDHEVRRRSRDDYPESVRDELVRHWNAGAYDEVIRVFQKHPFVAPPDVMALLRAISCEQLGKYASAAAFYSRALQMRPDDPELVAGAASSLLALFAGGARPGAKEYLDKLTRYADHPVIWAAAAAALWGQSTGTDGDERHALRERAGAALGRARAGWPALPEPVRADGFVRKLFAQAEACAADADSAPDLLNGATEAAREGRAEYARRRLAAAP